SAGTASGDSHIYGAANMSEGLVNDQHDMLVYVDIDGNKDNGSDIINGSWSVTIPDKLALTAASGTTAGQPGTYEGTAAVAYAGEIGTSQKLTVEAGAVTMHDSKGWSSDVPATVTDSGLAALDYATVKAAAGGSTKISAALGAGQWTGTCNYTISLTN
ncbi:MAG: hypothetical protein ACI4NA_05925, partial [Succinivibrio sp.]